MTTKFILIKQFFSTIIEKGFILFIVIISLTLGFVIGNIYTSRQIQIMAANHAAGQYNPNTGIFEWNKNIKKL
jgi:hypothetical protein